MIEALLERPQQASPGERFLDRRKARVFAPLLLDVMPRSRQPVRYKGAFGGRGSGKSHFFAEEVVETMLKQKVRIVCIREVQKSLDQSAKLLIEDKIDKFGLGQIFTPQKSIVKCDLNGSFCTFQGMQDHTAESIKSLEGYDIAWGEEAQSLSDRSLELLRPTIRKPRSQLWFSWNPDSEKDPVDRLLRKETPPNAIVVQANWDNNPFLEDVLVQEKDYDLRRDPDRYAHVWLGEYRRNSEARVFHNWKVEAFDTPPTARFYFGADWGYAVDPTVLVRCFVDDASRKLYVDQEAYKIGCELEDIPALFDQVPGSRRQTIIADSARPETISYIARKRFLIKPSKKGQGSVEDGIEFLKNYDIVVHPRCKHTADELAMYSWKVDKKTGDILPVLEDKHNHVIDALRYSVENLRRGAWVTNM
jgi:phage terminase large subunit